MASLPVLPAVWRCSVLMRADGGAHSQNTFHVEAGVLGEPDVTASADDVAATIDHALDGIDPWATLPSSYEFAELSLTNLTAATEGAVLVTSLDNAPVGTNGGDIIPGYAAVVTLRTGARGPQGRGRMFLGPLSEGSQVGGQLVAGVASDIATAWQTFRAEMAAPGGSLLPLQLGVASYTHHIMRPLSSSSQITVANRCGIIRRRQERS